MKSTLIMEKGCLLSLICGMFIIASCSTPGLGIFSKQTPHEAYEHKIRQAGLVNTSLGSAWFNAAQRSLLQPITIQLPYSETGYFAAERPGAAGYIFSLRRGETLRVSITTTPSSSFLLFADLWQPLPNSSPKLLLAADTLNYNMTYEVEKDDSYILRIQPELLQNGGYTVTITTGPSLAFPVPSENRPKVGSFWGAERDLGARRHEGIDIFDKFRTPVIAAADGHINSVREGGIGGKVIFLRPSNKNYTLYYAHLDSQIAREGQPVKTGDVIGLIGNTGNAKYTTPHLHFGIYTSAGAVDPLPFVDQTKKQPKNITAPLRALNDYVRSNKATEVFVSPGEPATVVEKIPAGTPLRVTGATASFYKVELPAGRHAFVRSNAVTHATVPIRNIVTDSAMVLLEDPEPMATGKKRIKKDEKLQLYGSYKDFYFVDAGGLKGWIRKE